jgi:hypothetical protein
MLRRNFTFFKYARFQKMDLGLEKYYKNEEVKPNIQELDLEGYKLDSQGRAYKVWLKEEAPSRYKKLDMNAYNVDQYDELYINEGDLVFFGPKTKQQTEKASHDLDKTLKP